jgi:hypothetical protein
MINSKYFIEDDSDDSDTNIIWSEEDGNTKNKSNNKKEMNKPNKSKIKESNKSVKEKETSLKNLSDPEINIEVVDDDGLMGVKISIIMKLNDGSDDTFHMDFTISKKTFLKIAKQLK